eukprot:7387848-Prymnesium_polylepis.1
MAITWVPAEARLVRRRRQRPSATSSDMRPQSSRDHISRGRSRSFRVMFMRKPFCSDAFEG